MRIRPCQLGAVLQVLWICHAPAAVLHVNVNSTNPIPPYTNWTSAATAIQDAINAAGPGDEILVTNGIYQTGDFTPAGGYAPARVALNQPITVISVNGPGVTQISGANASGYSYSAYGRRCAYLTNGAMLAGFTLSAGRVDFQQTRSDDQTGGGVLCASVNAVVSNCVITGNFSGHYGGGASSGTLVDCVVANNQALNLFIGGVGNGGGAYAGNLKNCIITNNVANYQGGGADSAALVNCLVANNGAYQGGGASGSDLVNCTVVGNTASTNGAGSGGILEGTAENSIIISNTSAPGGPDNFRSSTLSFCCTAPDPGGTGNITNDPAFVDYAGADYRLQLTSPCIDAGSNAYVTCTNDLDGNPRLVDGVVDMGAYEYQRSPWFLISPVSQVIPAGSNLSLTILALGDPPLACQWWLNGAPLTDGGRIIGAYSNSLSIAAAQTNDSGSYWVTVSNSFGIATSAVASVTVEMPVTITGQPANTTVLTGSNAMFTVTATGFAPPNYFWYSNGVPLTNGGRISGATSSALTLSNTQMTDSASYQVVGANNYGSATSLVATLTVLAPAQIIGQPASQAVLLGSNVTFAVTATGSSPGYQWFFNGTLLSDGGRISGSASPTLSLANIQNSDAGGYVAVVTNLLSVATTRTASLTPLASLASSVRFVSLNSTHPLPPFLDWNTAATNIQDAVDAGVDGDSVLVSNGVYQTGGRVVYGAVTNRVVIDKALTVLSFNGPTTTSIAGFNSTPTGYHYGRCVYLTNGASLIGFTLTNGGARTSGDPILEQSGGGIWCQSSSAIVSNCILRGNLAPNYYGGGAFGGTLINCVLTNNSASFGSGAASNVLLNCILVGNFPARLQNITYGGGAAFSYLTSCVISNNYATEGGGVCFGAVNNSIISSNRAYGYGGAACSNILSNCVLKNNLAEFGGGSSGGILFNCTIVSNTASETGGGVDSGSLANCIIYHNSSPKIPDFPNNSSCALNFCDSLSPATNGLGNITNEPLFLNLTAGDFHLQANSPCINSGNNSYLTNATDLDCNPRIVGGTVDMGAYEFQTPASVLSYAWSQQYGLPTDGTADYADSDGTGMNNWQKWIAGLNPTNPASVLAILPPATTTNSTGVTVIWQSVNTRAYYLQRSTNLSAQPAFSSIQSNIVGQAGTTTYKDTTATNGSLFFYRVGVQR